MAHAPSRPGIDGISVGLVALGGAAGSVARYALWERWPESVGVLRSTFVVAVVGCFALGAVLGATVRGRAPRVRVFAIGLCGGFASFSMYAVLGVTFATAWKGVAFLVITPSVALAAMAVGHYLTSPTGLRPTRNPIGLRPTRKSTGLRPTRKSTGLRPTRTLR